MYGPPDPVRRQPGLSVAYAIPVRRIPPGIRSLFQAMHETVLLAVLPALLQERAGERNR
jgi:hypothetical protein